MCLKQVDKESAGKKKEKGDKAHWQKQYDCVKEVCNEKLHTNTYPDPTAIFKLLRWGISKNQGIRKDTKAKYITRVAWRGRKTSKAHIQVDELLKIPL